MIDSGESGIDQEVLARFLALLPQLDGLGVFPERFTLELRTRRERWLFHVNRSRGVVRPVVAEDSRKRLVSLPLSHFLRLVEFGKPSHWREALAAGAIKVQ